MVSTIYLLCLITTLISLLYASQKKDRPVDRYLWTVMILLPVITLGYWLKTIVHTEDGAFIAFCFIYIDSTVLLTIAFFSILHSIRLHVSNWVKIGVYGITIFHLLTIWLSKDNHLYYASMRLIDTGVGVATKMTPGPLKMTHYAFLGLIFFVILVSLVAGLIYKGTYSKRNLICYAFFAFVGIIIYIFEMMVNVDFSSLPVMYAIGSVVLSFFYDNFQSHNIHSLIGEKQSRTGLRGFAAFDIKKRLIGYNTQFARFFPDIEKVVIDTVIKGKYQQLADFINPLLDKCIEQGNYTDTIYLHDKIFSIAVSAFTVSDTRTNGYLLELSDVTEEKKRVEIIEKYNERLAAAVKDSTDHILEIQNSVVLGMANLVENRDNNTGGHVKRTSAIIKMLVEEAVRQGLYKIDAEKASDIVRAAPMHDLGKMYIETAILCKPAKLTDEEYAKMKEHAPRSGEMVKIILDGVEEPHFVSTAYNIARYHHERWDGKGYPEGLMGKNIPMEARLMAVADVYDALVSKRCYKEAMSFELANKIMNENMGSQFDPAMRPVFNACRNQLEEYYSKQQ